MALSHAYNALQCICHEKTFTRRMEVGVAEQLFFGIRIHEVSPFESLVERSSC